MNRAGFKNPFATRLRGKTPKKPFLNPGRCGRGNFLLPATNEIYHGATCDESCTGETVLAGNSSPAQI
jgi:hypothetical protein